MPDRAPAFQFYPKDYESDEHVKLMDLAQEGAYLRLMSNQWMNGSIPSDICQLAKICRTTPAKMRALWPGLAPCFVVAAEGRLVNRRLERQREEMLSHRAERSEAGRRGANSKWHSHGSANGSAINQPLAKNGSPSPSASPTTEPPPPPASGGGGHDGRLDVLTTLARDLGVLDDARTQRRGWRNALESGSTIEALAAAIRAEAERRRDRGEDRLALAWVRDRGKVAAELAAWLNANQAEDEHAFAAANRWALEVGAPPGVWPIVGAEAMRLRRSQQ